MGFWDDTARRQNLVVLWNEGKSSQFIANIFGVSRSAVVGKIFRLRNSGVPLRGENDATNGQAAMATWQHRKNRLYKKKASSDRLLLIGSARSRLLDKLMMEARNAPPIEVTDEKPLVKSVLDLESQHCRFPLGDTKSPDFGFCGKPRHPNFPYCENHARRAFTPAHEYVRAHHAHRT